MHEYNLSKLHGFRLSKQKKPVPTLQNRFWPKLTSFAIPKSDT